MESFNTNYNNNFNNKDDSKDNNDYDTINYKSAFTGFFPSDPPLLQELGIDFNSIIRESCLVFNYSLQNIGDDSTQIPFTDFIGPLCYLLLYNCFLAIQGKIHFGYVYVLTLFSILGVYFLLNALIKDKQIHLIFCVNILGYSLLPISIFTLLNILLFFLSKSTRLIIGLVYALWSTYFSTKIISGKISGDVFIGGDKSGIIGYPLFLAYLCYILIGVF